MKVLFFAILTALVTQHATFADNSGQVEAIKNQIADISWRNISNEGNRAEIREQINALLGELVKLKPGVTQEDLVKLSPGSWQQIWSDEMMMDPPNAPQRDLTQVYQVVNIGGWGFNFGVRSLPNGQRITFGLGVEASVNGNQQTTEIVKAYMRSGDLLLGENLGNIAEQIHNGTSKDFQERNAGRFPNGPIGARGILTIHFIDEDLKIGTAPNVYTGRVELFVMQRTALVRAPK